MERLIDTILRNRAIAVISHNTPRSVRIEKSEKSMIFVRVTSYDTRFSATSRTHAVHRVFKLARGSRLQTEKTSVRQPNLTHPLS